MSFHMFAFTLELITCQHVIYQSLCILKYSRLVQGILQMYELRTDRKREGEE